MTRFSQCIESYEKEKGEFKIRRIRQHDAETCADEALLAGSPRLLESGNKSVIYTGRGKGGFQLGAGSARKVMITPHMFHQLEVLAGGDEDHQKFNSEYICHTDKAIICWKRTGQITRNMLF